MIENTNPIPTKPLVGYRRYYREIEKAAQKPATRTYTAAIFSFLAASLFLWYAILPTMRTVVFLRREIADKTIVRQKMEDKITSLIEAQAKFDEIQDSLPLINQAIPSLPEAVEVSVQLRNLAAVSQASISALAVSSISLLGQQATQSATATSPNATHEFPLAITVNGSYSALSAFLDGLLLMRRIVAIDAMGISTSTVSDVVGPLQVTLQLRSFY